MVQGRPIVTMAD